MATALGLLIVLVGVVGIGLWAMQAIAWRSRPATRIRERFELAAANSRAKGYKIRFEYVNAWLCSSRPHAAVAAVAYLAFTLFCAWLFLG